MFKTFQDYTDANKPKIDLWLDRYLQSASSPDIQTLVGRGGKRLRPLLCLLAYKGYGGEDEEVIMPAAGAIELMHTFLLIHDDIIDRDQWRWGGQNITGVYFEEYSRTMTAANALHYSQSQALLAGDICQALATTSLLQSTANSKVIVELVNRYNNVLFQVLHGEKDDVAMSQAYRDPALDQVFAMYKKKTASYSFVLPLQFGALLAGHSHQADLLEEVGNLAGISYQLQDDILGLFGDDTKTGKPNTSDLREGKRTMLITEALRRVPRDERMFLQNLLGNDVVNVSDLIVARTIIKESGALVHAEQLMRSCNQKAIEHIKNTSLSDQAKHLLIDGLTVFTNRTL
jgi:geranylgeranyl diphosphate synthase, type II